MSSNISFAQNLQSDAGQKAIMFRLESEIRVLEILKKFITIQIRLEKEFTNSSENATTAAMKAIHSIISEGSTNTDIKTTFAKFGSHKSIANFPNESVISMETVNVMEEVQCTTTTLKRNVEFLETNTLNELNELITQKKILLKSAEEEYNKIKVKLNQFTEFNKKQKAEYFKHFKSYELARTKFEENCAKGSTGNPKKSETSREKFFRTKRQLNISHAEYLLIIQESIVYDRDFRTILLPGLLQIEQTWCEKQLTQWSQILNEILNNSSGISHAVRFKLKEFEFGKEYTELISRHKCPPLRSMDFKFEPSCMSSQPVTQGNLIVDSSTVDFLRRKLTDVEKRVTTTEAQLSENLLELEKTKSKNMLEDLKSFEISSIKCEIDRLKHLKFYIENSLKGIENTNEFETISQISDTSVKKPGNRFTTFIRNAATLTKKAVSFDDESETPIIQVNNTSSTINLAGKSNLTNGSTKRDLTSAIAEEDWFHGVLPREDVVRLLNSQGDYLVRETIKNGEEQLVLSVFWEGPKHFMVQTTPDGQFRFEGPIFASVKELLQHYVRTKMPVTNRSGTLIVKPIRREKWELNNDDLQLIEKIGKGNFGDVYKASINGSLVAVKTCKMDHPEEQKRKFLQEGRILKQYNHPNIVRFVGICVQKQPIMIVMELVSGGSLLTYLKSKGKSLSAKDFTKMCLNTAAGMKYLEERNCLHRDLAARNCLIDENSFVKISDFGMSREEHEYTVSDGMKQIPIKWTAPEALNYGRYTTLSDVWSYGILIWEIFSLGSTPYPGMSNSRAREMVEAGYRMSGPVGIPDVIYQLMARCWLYEPEQRPRFAEIHSELEIISNSDLI